MIATICVYCGSAAGVDPAYAAATRSFARLLADAGVTLVYGGGRVGLMGILADEVLARGGKAIGVIPERLLAKEVGHHGLSELHVVKDMHERKKMMADQADAFVALPGGVGTYEELFETYTLGAARLPRQTTRAAQHQRLLQAAARYAAAHRA